MANQHRPIELPALADRLEVVPCISMTLAEAGPACGVSAHLLRQFIDAGTLRAKRTSEAGVILVTPAALRDWYDSLPNA